MIPPASASSLRNTCTGLGSSWTHWPRDPDKNPYLVGSHVPGLHLSLLIVVLLSFFPGASGSPGPQGPPGQCTAPSY